MGVPCPHVVVRWYIDAFVPCDSRRCCSYSLKVRKISKTISVVNKKKKTYLYYLRAQDKHLETSCGCQVMPLPLVIVIVVVGTV
jgi:hypothetical protein